MADREAIGRATNRPIEGIGPHTRDRSRAQCLSHSMDVFEGFPGPIPSYGMMVAGERDQVDRLRSAASVIGLSPVTSSAQDDSISELLRFL